MIALKRGGFQVNLLSMKQDIVDLYEDTADRVKDVHRSGPVFEAGPTEIPWGNRVGLALKQPWPHWSKMSF